MSSYKCCDSSTLEFSQTDSLATLLKLVGDENRLRLLCLLQQGEHCVCEILDHFEMSQSLVSHHLADLKDAQLVRDRKKGRKVFYSLTKKGMRITTSIFLLKKELV
jgi:ArsR family transcriptional regulator